MLLMPVIPDRHHARLLLLIPVVALVFLAAGAESDDPPFSSGAAPTCVPTAEPSALDGAPQPGPSEGAEQPQAFECALPSAPWALGLDLKLSPGGQGSLEFPPSPGTVRIRRRGRTLTVAVGGRSLTLAAGGGGAPGGWTHLEAIRQSDALNLALGGAALAPLRGPGQTLRIAVERGRLQFSALLPTRADPPGLLLQRLATIHSLTPRNMFPKGTGRDGRLRFGSGWTSGFWAGALWRAYGLTGIPTFRSWALTATKEHLGMERAPTHDVGFMYSESSVAGYERVCPKSAPAPLCVELRRSGLSAADTLVRLAATNRRAGMIPTGPRGPDATTIIDSMMNLNVLLWAASVTGKPRFGRLAAEHAHTVARLLVRQNGSTAQAVTVRRADGKALSISTRQGLAAWSTWSRGEGWSLYGFAQAGQALGDRALVRVAESNAAYVAEHLPPSGIPMWDYDAPPGSRPDVSAGVITAAGLFHLARACQTLPGTCTDPERWVRLGEWMLQASVARVSRKPPLGFLGDQVGTFNGGRGWDSDAELIFGLDYVLEAIALAPHAGYGE
jgi:unsaturated chondroitin disaccharide hydrolase